MEIIQIQIKRKEINCYILIQFKNTQLYKRTLIYTNIHGWISKTLCRAKDATYTPKSKDFIILFIWNSKKKKVSMVTEVRMWFPGEGTWGRVNGKGHKKWPCEVMKMFYILFCMVVAQITYLQKLIKLNV